MNTGPGDLLGMSDDDFGKLTSPPVAEATGTGVDDTKPDDDDNKPASTDGSEAGDDTGTDTGDGEQGDNGEGGEPAADKTNVADPSDKSKESDNLSKDKSQEQGKSPDGGTKTDDAKAPVTGSDTKGEAVPPDYKAFYEKLMAPLKANGKTIEIKNPDEAVQLMQMGANYTRKMQALAPHRKVLLMLENNGLLDEGKLSFLIDIEKKNPEAIRKLIKDSGIDPLDIDTTQVSTYQEGNHRVADDEVGFRTALDELSSNPEGVETLKVINTQWDQASKEILWKQPDVMELINQQRADGTYDLITTELERQRLLGQVPPNVPFLHAYKKIGDDLAQAGAFNHLSSQHAGTKPHVPVATRTAAPKQAVTNNDKASAASTTRSTSRKADTVVNPLALSDDEFMKQVDQFKGRV